MIDRGCLGFHVSCDLQRGGSIRWLSAEIQKSEVAMYDLEFVSHMVCSTSLPSGNQVDGLPLAASTRAVC